jgi:hypothetical protein
MLLPRAPPSSLLVVSAGFADRFDGSIDLSSAFVDAIVDVDVVDMASFSVTYVRFGEPIVDDLLCLRRK